MVRVSKHTISVSAACKWSRGFHGTCEQLSEARGVLNAPHLLLHDPLFLHLPLPSRPSYTFFFCDSCMAFSLRSQQRADHRFSDAFCEQLAPVPERSSFTPEFLNQERVSCRSVLPKWVFAAPKRPGAALAWAAGRGEFACSIKSEKKCVKIGTLRTKPG